MVETSAVSNAYCCWVSYKIQKKLAEHYERLKNQTSIWSNNKQITQIKWIENENNKKQRLIPAACKMELKAVTNVTRSSILDAAIILDIPLKKYLFLK